MIHPVIRLRKDMRQPYNGDLSYTQSFSIAVCRNMLVEKACKIHALHVREQQWSIIYTFCFNFQQFFHAPRVRSFSYLVKK